MPEPSIRRYLKHGTLTQLRVFEASARLGSLARAADELHLAQPTVSVQIKKLSETVGFPLFEQVGRRLYLTPAGERVYASCEEVFRALANLEEELAEMRGLHSGELRLAASSAAKCIAPRLLAAFVERYPGIRSSLEIHNRSALIERLANNRDDLYLLSGPPAEPQVVVQAGLPNPLVVFARSDHPLARERNIAFARLAREPLLLREPGSGTRTAALGLFARHGLAPRIRMELGSDEAIGQAILAGLGIAILSRYAFGLGPPPQKLVCLDVEGFPVQSEWYFAYPSGKRLPLPARAFMDFARAEARRLFVEAISPQEA